MLGYRHQEYTPTEELHNMWHSSERLRKILEERREEIEFQEWLDDETFNGEKM